METTDLDQAVAQAVYMAALLERALHDGHGWAIRVGDQTLPTTRTVESDGIAFRASWKACYCPTPVLMLLVHRGEIVATKPMSPDVWVTDPAPGTPFDFEWVLAPRVYEKV